MDFFCGKKGEPGEVYLVIENGKLIKSDTNKIFDESTLTGQM